MTNELPRNATKIALRVASRILASLRNSIDSDEFAGIAYSARAAVHRESVLIILKDPTGVSTTQYDYRGLLDIGAEDATKEANSLLRTFRAREGA